MFEALYASDRYLKHLGLNRQYLHEFWIQHTPEGRQADEKGLFGAWFEDIYDNDALFLQVIQDIQRFVFGDEGDEAMGLEGAPASEEELTGIFDSATYIRMSTYLDFNPQPTLIESSEIKIEPNEYLIVGGNQVPVEGDVQIVSMGEPGGLDLARNSKKGYTRWPEPLENLAGKHKKYARLLGFVHWDAGWSAEGAYRILLKRGLGTCMGIDRPRKEDGAVICYQWLDPGLYYGWHGSAANPRSVMSFDMSNAVYSKYASKYKELCGIPRPVLRISAHEKIGVGRPFLGFYKDQILSLLRVLKALGKHLGMPYHWPLKKDGSFQGRNYRGLFTDDFHGVAEHRHLPDTSKWDCRGLFAQICALLLSEPQYMAEFPEFVEAHRLQDSHWGQWLDEVKEHWEWEELWMRRAGEE